MWGAPKNRGVPVVCEESRILELKSGPLVHGTPWIESAHMENMGRTVAASTVVYFLVFRRQGGSRNPTCLQGDIRTAGRLRRRRHLSK